MTYDAIVLTGGRARRLGGADKAALLVGGRPLAERASGAVAGAARLIVVGPWPPNLHLGRDRDLVVTREDPPGSGPVAAIAEGMRHVGAPQVMVLAVDQPFLTAAAVESLRANLAASVVAVPVDEEGRRQPLCAAWRSDGLRTALDAIGDPRGLAVRRLVDAAGPVAHVRGLTVDGRPPPWFDCDTPTDLAQAEGWA